MQAAPGPAGPRRDDRQGRGAGRGGRRARAPAWWRSPRRSCPATPTGSGGPGPGMPTATALYARLLRPGGRRPGPPPPTCSPTSPARPGSGCRSASNERDGRLTIYNTLLLLRPRRRRSPAGTASSCPPAASGWSWGMGDGSTLTRHRHAVRPARRADLLGELHAAGPRRDVRPGRRHLARAHLGQLRRVGRDDAAHREGGPNLRARRHLVPPRRRPPGRPPRPGGPYDGLGDDDAGCRAATR